MRDNYFKPGDCVLRAKIDMSSPNMHMRDPIMYRIINHEHHRTKGNWVIYPTYDWAHGQSDYIEKSNFNLNIDSCLNNKSLHLEIGQFRPTGNASCRTHTARCNGFQSS